MLEGSNPVFQALLGTLFTWGLTAAGAALVFVFASGRRKVLDGSLGFAGGVMTAASYWSLLAPAIEMAEQSGSYGDKGQWAFIPVAIGFIMGAAFVYGADLLLPYMGVTDPAISIALATGPKIDKDVANQADASPNEVCDLEMSAIDIYSFPEANNVVDDVGPRPQRRRVGASHSPATADNGDVLKELPTYAPLDETAVDKRQLSWKRMVLLITAITIHNIPEGLAVGVGFGAIGKSSSATFENARNLAIGIGIQNFPEGLAVSLPLRGSGMSVWKSFFYGQLSGMVEPIAGLFGAAAVIVAEPLLPYALAFAAGAMIYVVVDDIIPESQTCGNGKLASWGAIVGFVIMMSLDVGLG